MNKEVDTKPKEKTPTGWASFWTKQMQAAENRLRNFNIQGNKVTLRYLGGNMGGQGSQVEDRTLGGIDGHRRGMQLNFFHTNIKTLQAQLYGSVPKVDVSREFQDPSDDVARVGALILQRILQCEIESSGEEFPTALRSALQDRLLPGLGVCRVRYEMESSQREIENPVTGKMEEVSEITYENAPVDYVHWQDFRWGWCRVWSEMPWCAFRAYMTREQANERFGEEKAGELAYKDQSPSGMDSKDAEYDKDQANNIKTAEVWEIWSKKEGKVFWWSSGVDKILDEKEDPLGLDGFWPMPRPLMANITTSLMTPKSDYFFAQDIYNEIDTLGTRISIITEACKVVGVYDSSAGESVGRMLDEGTDNMLIPVENWAMFGEKGGLQGSIDWFPTQEIASVLALLNSQLEETKALLYEVTGMSDIVNGGKTDQYVSDGTNRLKAKFGSIKIQSFQDEFARFASDLESIKAEVISKHFSEKTIASQSNAKYLPEVDHQYIVPALQMIKSPELRWRVNIKPESISLADYAELQNERVAYLTAVGTFLQSAAPIIEAEPATKPMMLEMLKFGLSAYKGSDYMEGMFDKMIDDAAKAEQMPQPEENPDVAKIQAKEQADTNVAVLKGNLELQKIREGADANVREIMAKSQADAQKNAEEHQSSMTEISAHLDADLQVEAAQSEMAIAEKTVEHSNTMTENQASHEQRMREIDNQQDKPNAG